MVLYINILDTVAVQNSRMGAPHYKIGVESKSV